LSKAKPAAHFYLNKKGLNKSKTFSPYCPFKVNFQPFILQSIQRTP
jgi:hypothetical protein